MTEYNFDSGERTLMTEYNFDQVIAMIRAKVEKFPYDRVYWTLRQIKRRWFKSQVKSVRLCMAINDVGFPVTTSLLSMLNDVTVNSALNTLHNLGDSHVLTLVRDKKGDAYRWYVSEEFLKKYRGES